MDYEQFRADTTANLVAAILSTGGPVTETIVEAVAYKPIVDHAITIADYIIKKLIETDSEFKSMLKEHNIK
jgi:hypothetical protein